jgi:hypothetical protein
VDVFDQALTRLSGFFLPAERAIMALSVVLGAGLPGARATYRVRSGVAISSVRKAPHPIDPGPRRRSWHALCSWLASHTAVLGARGFCPVIFPFPAIWRLGEWQFPRIVARAAEFRLELPLSRVVVTYDELAADRSRR